MNFLPKILLAQFDSGDTGIDPWNHRWLAWYCKVSPASQLNFLMHPWLRWSNKGWVCLQDWPFQILYLLKCYIKHSMDLFQLNFSLSFIYFCYGHHLYSQQGSITGTEVFDGSLSTLGKAIPTPSSKVYKSTIICPKPRIIVTPRSSSPNRPSPLLSSSADFCIDY